MIVYFMRVQGEEREYKIQMVRSNDLCPQRKMVDDYIFTIISINSYNEL